MIGAMFTPLPFPDYLQSTRVLDRRDIESVWIDTIQTLTVLAHPDKFRHAPMWRNPGVRMWTGYGPALVGYAGTVYHSMPVKMRQANRTAMEHVLTYADTIGWTEWLTDRLQADELPWWFGWPDLHLSHQAKLARTSPRYYSNKLNVNWRNVNQPTIWPIADKPGEFRTKDAGSHGKWSLIHTTDFRNTGGTTCLIW